VIGTDAYFPNDQTSNGEAKGIEDEGKIKMMKARSNKRAANRGDRLARAALMDGRHITQIAMENRHAHA
jgi:hypothetical protein